MEADNSIESRWVERQTTMMTDDGVDGDDNDSNEIQMMVVVVEHQEQYSNIDWKTTDTIS